MHLHPNQAPPLPPGVVGAQSVAFGSGNLSHICIAKGRPDDNSLENLGIGPDLLIPLSVKVNV